MTDLVNAKHEISAVSADAVKAIAVAAEAAGKVITTAANEASQVVVNNATQTAKQLTVRGSDDHDRLVILDTKMDALSEQIKELKDNNAKRIDQLETEKLNCRDSYPVLYKKDIEEKLEDHENRIRVNTVRIITILTVGSVIWGGLVIVMFIINHWY